MPARVSAGSGRFPPGAVALNQAIKPFISRATAFDGGKIRDKVFVGMPKITETGSLQGQVLPVILYELATGTLPFEVQSAGDVIIKQATENTKALMRGEKKPLPTPRILLALPSSRRGRSPLQGLESPRDRQKR